MWCYTGAANRMKSLGRSYSKFIFFTCLHAELMHVTWRHQGHDMAGQRARAYMIAAAADCTQQRIKHINLLNISAHVRASSYSRKENMLEMWSASCSSRINISKFGVTASKAGLTQSVKTVRCPATSSILAGRHIKAAILNHISRRTSNDYWAPAYFNINSLEAGIGGRRRRRRMGVSGKSAAAGRIRGALWLRPLCFIEAIFQCLFWQHLRLLNCGLQGTSERGSGRGGKRGREEERSWEEEKGERLMETRKREND